MAPFKEKVTGNRFDTELSALPILASQGDHFDLRIRIRIHLDAKNPPNGAAEFAMRDWPEDYDKNRHKAIRWGQGEFVLWQRLYLHQVNRFWDDMFILTPPSSYRGFDYPPGKSAKPRVAHARFIAQLVDSAVGAHVSIPIYRLSPEAGGFRSHARLYSHRDIAPEKKSHKGFTWEFFTTKHEVGHLLGLGHSNENSPECKAKMHSDVCYGVNTAQKTNIMGEGNLPSLDLAGPWLKRAEAHTGIAIGRWKVDWTTDAWEKRNNVKLG